jgi:hypothetical protein
MWYLGCDIITAQVAEPTNVKRACNLWKGFLLSKNASPELALVFCKGALMALNPSECNHVGGALA